MTHKTTLLTCLTCASFATLPTAAFAADAGVGVAAGTTGLSVEAKVAFSEHVMLRGAFNLLDVSVDVDGDDLTYDGDTSLTGVGAFADIAPFGNAFVVSGGAYFGSKDIDLVAAPRGNVELGGVTFTPEQVGTLDGRAEFADFAPYAGIGYDGFATSRGPWSLNARAGVMFVGSADVTLASSGGEFSADPRLAEQLRAEE